MYSNIKAVIFDIDGTLYPIKYLKGQFIKVFLKHPQKIRVFFKARKKVRDTLLSSPLKSMTRAEFLDEQCKCVNKKSGYFDAVYKALRKNRHFKPYKDVEALLTSFKKEGYYLSVLSDFPLETKLQELGLYDYFDSAFSSEDCGFLKPDKRAFEYLLKNIPYKAEECLFIGDSLSKDVKGSKAVGMSAELISSVRSS